MSTDIPLVCNLLRKGAEAPSRGRQEDAGFDVTACFPADMNSFVEQSKTLMKDGSSPFWEEKAESLIIPPGHRAMIPIGVATACLPDVVLQAWPRSGLALKHGIEVLAGVIDSGYRDEVCFILRNGGLKPFAVKSGDRIGQLLPVRLQPTNLLSMMPLLELPGSQRGEKGFGSSGQ